MPDIGTKIVDSADSAAMKAITRYVFTPAIIVLCSISALYLRSLADKVDGAAAKADVEKTAVALKADGDAAKEKLWSAIGETTKAQSQLTTNIAVLKSQLEEHVHGDAAEASFVHNTISDIQARLNRASREPSREPLGQN